MGTRCTTWYRWERMDRWECTALWCTHVYTWDVSWDPSVPHRTDGTGWTGGNTQSLMYMCMNGVGTDEGVTVGT